MDDDLEYLKLMNRGFKVLGDHWDVTLADNSREALRLLAQHPHFYDAVLSDLELDELSGREVLQHVVGDQPRALRLLITAFPDADRIQAFKNVAHYILLKPVNPVELGQILERGFAYREFVHRPELIKLIGAIEDLPTLPRVYQDLREVCAASDYSMDQVAEVISRDAAVTARLLRFVNSSYFGLRSKATHPKQAVTMLGINIIQGMVLASSLLGGIHVSQDQFSLEDLWMHNLLVSQLTGKMAEVEKMPEHYVDIYRVAGLLHDAGKLLLLDKMPQKYFKALKMARDNRVDLLEAEQKILGTTHAEVGAYLMELWQLPTPVVEAVAFHHQPLKSGHTGFTTIAAVHAANILAHRLNPLNLIGEAPVLDQAFIEQAGLLDHVELWRECSETLA